MTILPRTSKRPAGLPRPSAVERTTAFGNHVKEWALSVEGEPPRVIDFSAFARDNALTIHEAQQIRRLGIGRTVAFGGGAAPTALLTRIA